MGGDLRRGEPQLARFSIFICQLSIFHLIFKCYSIKMLVESSVGKSHQFVLQYDLALVSTCIVVPQKSLSRFYNHELMIFSRSKKCYKLIYWTILPFNPCRNWSFTVHWGILFVISSCLYRDQEFFPEGSRRHSWWCWCVKKYRAPCLSCALWCSEPRYRRGGCFSCYFQLFSLVAGAAAWRQFLSSGVLIPYWQFQTIKEEIS